MRVGILLIFTVVLSGLFGLSTIRLARCFDAEHKVCDGSASGNQGLVITSGMNSYETCCFER